MRRVGVVGARGHTGSELLRILDDNEHIEISYAGSRELAGQGVPQVPGLTFEDASPEAVSALGLDGVFLALPNGISGPFVSALPEGTAIVDISADHRFDAAWVYGLTELNREKLAGARRISNPGCYATVMQLAIYPFLDRLGGVPAVFGVSGYSGAGTTPSEKNDPARLADNLMPYKLTNHIHEREATLHLGTAVRFMPHVHPAFRGLVATVHIPLAKPIRHEEASEILSSCYEGEPLIEVRDSTPELVDGTGATGVLFGGVEVSDDGMHLVLVGALDNLLKGAAVQAAQNMNLALGMPELSGIS